MPSSQGFTITASGRLSVVDFGNVTQPTVRRGAFTFDATQALVTVVAGTVPAVVANGFAFSAEGAVQIVLTDVVIGTPVYLAGIPRGTGSPQAVQCTDANAVHHWENGLPFDALGLLCVQEGGVAPLGGPFSQGFSWGFE